VSLFGRKLETVEDLDAAEARKLRLRAARERSSWTEIPEPVVRGRWLVDAATDRAFTLYRGATFFGGRLEFAAERTDPAFYVDRAGDIVVLEPTGRTLERSSRATGTSGGNCVTRAVVRLGRIYGGEGPGEIPNGLLRYCRGGMRLAPWLKAGAAPDRPRRGKADRPRPRARHLERRRRRLAHRPLRPLPDAPDWIRRGTPASFRSILLRESTVVEGLIHGATVLEASLLLRDKPAEPGARVVLLRDVQPTHEPAVLRRNCGTVLGVR